MKVEGGATGDMVNADDLNKYEVIVGYGIGQNYERIKQRLEGKITFNFLADTKWEESEIQEYDGIPVIRIRALKQLKRVLVVLFPTLGTVRDVIMRELAETDADICYIHDLFQTEYSISGSDLARLLPEKEYCDEFHNRILFDETIPQNITVHFSGRDSLLDIGRNLSVNRLDIYCGNRAFCKIGDDTSIVQAACMVSDAELKIGKDCMLSCEIVIRTHDDHHIFDRLTHQRINAPKSVIIGHHVWIGYRTMLLAGTHIGDGSIIGAGAVTSSDFGDHVLAAGCPAKVIREDVCWSRDDTAYFQRSRLEDCIDQNALKYM